MNSIFVKVPGKMVLYNHDWTGYNPEFRTNGAIVASQYGAVAVLIRSLATFSLYSPHTGVMVCLIRLVFHCVT